MRPPPRHPRRGERQPRLAPTAETSCDADRRSTTASLTPGFNLGVQLEAVEEDLSHFVSAALRGRQRGDANAPQYALSDELVHGIRADAQVDSSLLDGQEPRGNGWRTQRAARGGAIDAALRA